MATVLTDRELLEQAAKAAGLNVEWHFGCGNALAYVEKNASPHLFWNPLNDDGDALRLAVKCGIDLHTWPLMSGTQSSDPWVRACIDRLGRCCQERALDDANAAARRAIVRAAAAIGRAMP